MPLPSLPHTMQPERVHLSQEARTNYAFLRNRETLSDNALDAYLRDDLARHLRGANTIEARHDRAVEFRAEDLIWVVRDDARSITDVRSQAEPS